MHQNNCAKFWNLTDFVFVFFFVSFQVRNARLQTLHFERSTCKIKIKCKAELTLEPLLANVAIQSWFWMDTHTFRISVSRRKPTGIVHMCDKKSAKRASFRLVQSIISSSLIHSTPIPKKSSFKMNRKWTRVCECVQILEFTLSSFTFGWLFEGYIDLAQYHTQNTHPIHASVDLNSEQF